MPAQEDLATVHLTGKVHQAKKGVLELNAKHLELPLIPLDLTREALRSALQLLGASPRVVDSSRRGDEVKLQESLTPTAMRPHHILDDFANERQRAVCLI